MRNFRFWLPTILGALITPPLFFAALMSTGAGHGSYGIATVVYPFPMLILVMSAGATPPGGTTEMLKLVLIVGLAILQFPIYGFVLSYAHLKGGWWLIAGGMVCLHLVVIVVWLVLAGLIWGTVGS